MSHDEHEREARVDPGSVPPFPVLALEIREGDSGAEVWLDGARVEVLDESGAPVGEELTLDDPRLFAAGRREAGERAAARTGAVKAVRAIAVRPDGQGGQVRDELVIDSDGRAVPAPTEVKRTRGSGRSRWSGLDRRRRITIVAALMVSVLAMGAIVGLAWPSGDEAQPVATKAARPTPPPSPTPTQLPVLGPDGQVTTAAWSIGPLASEDAPVKVVGHRVVTVTDDDQLVGVDPKTSGRKWAVDVGSGGEVVLSVTRDAGRDMVTAASGDRVVAVDARSGRTVWSRSLSSEEEAITTPGGVVVKTSQVAAEIRDARGRWVTRVVPPGAEPVAPVGDDGLLAVNSSGQVWEVTSARVPPKGSKLKAPESGAAPRGMLGASSEGLLFAWKVGSKQRVQQYRWNDLDSPARTVTAGTPDGGEPEPGEAVWSPDGSLVVLDETAVDLRSGKVVQLPQGWETAAVLDDRVYAEPEEGALQVWARGSAKPSKVTAAGAEEAGLAVPVASLGQGQGVAIAGPEGGNPHLYAVRVPKVPTPPAPSKKPKSSTKGTPKKSKAAKKSKPGTSKGKGAASSTSAPKTSGGGS